MPRKECTRLTVAFHYIWWHYLRGKKNREKRQVRQSSKIVNVNTPNVLWSQTRKYKSTSWRLALFNGYIWWKIFRQCYRWWRIIQLIWLFLFVAVWPNAASKVPFSWLTVTEHGDIPRLIGKGNFQQITDVEDTMLKSSTEGRQYKNDHQLNTTPCVVLRRRTLKKDLPRR